MNRSNIMRGRRSGGRGLGRPNGGHSGQGACGGIRRRDGSGNGTGNRGTGSQPPKK